MIRRDRVERRHLLGYAAAGAGGILLAGWAPAARADWLTRVLDSEEIIDRRVQSALTPADAKGRLYTKDDISAHFRSNGTHEPANPEYQALLRNNFRDWRLTIDGLIAHPQHLSLADLKTMPGVSQITRHDCVEGWSCIAEWSGVRLATLLAMLGVEKKARYVMFFCYDTVAGAREPYYESIDLVEAVHPETILAYGMNGQTLAVPYGAPLRLRLGRQLGYKMAKYLRRITLVESFAAIEGGHGGFYEDNGYEWYAGI